MKTLILKVKLKEEEDGRWSASIPALSGCSSWGYSKQEALNNIKDAAEIYIEDMIDAGEGIPSQGYLTSWDSPKLSSRNTLDRRRSEAPRFDCLITPCSLPFSHYSKIPSLLCLPSSLC
jgi:predicted RNase H-like HicB family nuclease